MEEKNSVFGQMWGTFHELWLWETALKNKTKTNKKKSKNMSNSKIKKKKGWCLFQFKIKRESFRAQTHTALFSILRTFVFLLYVTELLFKNCVKLYHFLKV